MNATDVIKEFASALNKIIGLVCSDVVAGQGVGTSFNLSFGRVVSEKVIESKGKYHKFEVYEAEVFVEDATWRLEDGAMIVCSSTTSDNSPESSLVVGLKKLIGKKVINACVHNAGHDLEIRFDDGMRVCVFAVPIDEELTSDCYTVLMPSIIYAVDFDGLVAISKRRI